MRADKDVYIVLVRGINLVGKNRLSMKDLKLMLERNGCSDVRTYIQSGNAVLRTAMCDAAGLAKRLAAAVSKSRGFEPRVLVLPRGELVRAAARNPFSEADGNPTSLHLFFLADAPKKPDLKGFQALKTTTERFELIGKVLYLYTPDGFGTSKLAARAEKLLGVDATARNWRTVKTLIEMSKD